jgi:GNAT superfamily N-acetyltransferase
MSSTIDIAEKLEVLPATGERWPAVAEFFANHPCSCQYWRLSAGDYGRRDKTEIAQWQAARQAELRSQMESDLPPGMLAYLDGELVGWCGFGPRPQMERLVRSRTIPKLDEQPVWAVVCFIVKVGYRRQGIADALLAGTVEYARQQGAPGLEAYPVDPEGDRINTSSAYVGTTSMFARAGFERVLMTDSTSAGQPRWLMRLEFDQ